MRRHRPAIRGAARTLLAAWTAALLAAVPLDALSQDEPPAADDAEVTAAADAPGGDAKPGGEDAALPTLSPVLVTAPRESEAPPGASTLDAPDLAAKRTTSPDTARLLEDVPGVSLYGAGGISSLPAIRGLADERLRIEIDGAEPTAACPNHMNPALSYIAPTKVGSVTVYSGITPVSVGGDSIGGTIQVESAPPAFAAAPGELLAEGEAGAFFRSNGAAYGYNASGTIASDALHVTYTESNAQADNYTAARGFKAAGIGSLLPGDEWLASNVVGSSSYEDLSNRSVRLAMRSGDHLLEVNAGLQQVGFEGFPNQRMDMTSNRNLQLGFGYSGQYGWGELEASLYGQNTRHGMDMGSNRFFYGLGMPMDSRARTRGGSIGGDIALTERDLLRVGSEFQTYDLDDWWPPVGTKGVMAPDTFWNIRDGVRDRIGLYGEWEARWSPRWTTVIGVRGGTVASSAGQVEGYSSKLTIWTRDAAAFNALDRRRRDFHLDVSTLARFAPHETLTLEAGYARQTRSPSLYERYPWSTNAMAALMNNFAGDGNGYIGNVDLQPEVAHTIAGTVDWHDATDDAWGLRATATVTRVDDFIDARRCNFGQCSALNTTRTTGFVLLQYVNQAARLYGVDVLAHARLVEFDRLGSLTATVAVNWIRGENLITDDDLFHIMPLNGKVGLTHRLGPWTTTAELQVVDAKTRVSQVRNEVPTESHSLFNLRSSYEWDFFRLDVSIDNVLDRFYDLPLGGAYLGQGPSMSTATIPWGVSVPGMGRSYNVALTLKF